MGIMAAGTNKGGVAIKIVNPASLIPAWPARGRCGGYDE